MIKGQLIEIIRKRLSGGSTTADGMHKVDQRVIEVYVNGLFSTYLNALAANKKSKLDSYIKPYMNVAVTLDTATDSYYSLFPAAPARLSKTGDAIRDISTEQGTGIGFCPMEDDFNDMLVYTEAYDLDDVISYTVTDRIDYQGTGIESITEVRVKMIPQFSEYDDDDEVPIPVGFEQQIIDTTVRYFQNQPLIDQVNNNNERT